MSRLLSTSAVSRISYCVSVGERGRGRDRKEAHMDESRIPGCVRVSDKTGREGRMDG